MNDKKYICTLSHNERLKILKKLKEKGLKYNNIKIALNSRLCDIEEVVKYGLN